MNILRNLNFNWRTRSLLACLLGSIVLGSLFFLSDVYRTDDPAVGVVKDYIQATYARDFARAYRLISNKDKPMLSEADYVGERGAYDGFTLRLAKSLAADMDFRVIEDTRNGERARIKIGFKLPSPEDLAPWVEKWNSEKLNSLAPARQEQILQRVEKLRRERKLIMVDSQESFELIKEGKDWHLFFGWAGGAKVRFGFRAPSGNDIEMEFQEKEIVASPKEPFLVHFKVKNRGRQEVTARIVHRIEPAAARENLQMIQCGLLSPIDLSPGSDREMAGIYLLDALPDLKHVSITYEFHVAPSAAAPMPRVVAPVKRN